MRTYFPDELSSDSISRDLLLKIIYHKDNEKFKSLTEIVKNVNEFNSIRTQNYQVSLNSTFVNHLMSFNSIQKPVRQNGKIYSYNSRFITNNLPEYKNLSTNERKKLKRDALKRYLLERKIKTNENNQQNNILIDNNNVIN